MKEEKKGEEGFRTQEHSDSHTSLNFDMSNSQVNQHKLHYTLALVHVQVQACFLLGL